jgi:hypothetical protein
MNQAVISKIHELVDSIEDENTLIQVMEDINFYISKKDIVDELSSSQLIELNEAIAEADRKETISWKEFKNELGEWRKQ